MGRGGGWVGQRPTSILEGGGGGGGGMMDAVNGQLVPIFGPVILWSTRTYTVFLQDRNFLGVINDPLFENLGVIDKFRG